MVKRFSLAVITGMLMIKQMKLRTNLFRCLWCGEAYTEVAVNSMKVVVGSSLIWLVPPDTALISPNDRDIS